MWKKVKRNDRYSSEKHWTREKHLNITTFAGTEKCTLNIKFYQTPKQLQTSDEKHPKTCFDTWACKAPQFFSIWQRLLIGSLNVWRMEKKHFYFCRIYFFGSRWRFLLLNNRWRSTNRVNLTCWFLIILYLD